MASAVNNQSDTGENNLNRQTLGISATSRTFTTPLGPFCSVKLNHDNFLLWKNMVLPVIRGNKMEGFITDAKECPPEFIEVTEEGADEAELKENPEHENWVAQDQVLLGWLYNSIDIEVASELIGYETSKLLWEAIRDLFGVRNISNIVYYKKEFNKLQKGNMKMSEYLKNMKRLVDNLALAGHRVTLDDLISQTLTGLDSSEYNPVVCQIIENENITWLELQSKLLRRGGRNSNNSRPICQECGKIGHVAAHCYYRYDNNYIGAPPENTKNNQHSVFVATPEMVSDPSWYADSGASTHVTNDSSQLSQKQNYNAYPVSPSNQVQCYLVNPSSSQSKLSSVSKKEVWHRRLGHPSDRVLSKILKTCNQKIEINETVNFCDACQYGKSHLLPFSKSTSHASIPLELIHTDIWGPSPVISNSGFKYYIHFVDDFSRYTWIYPLKQKSDALSIFLQFKALVENQFDRKIKAIQSDVGGEFWHSIKVFLPLYLSQNGRAERKHRHIVETGLTLLAQANMPLKYWPDAFHTATFLINRLPTPVLQDSTPFSKLFSKQPNYMSFKGFGCACFPCLRTYQRHKFQFYSTKCVFLSYSDFHKGYKCLSSTGRVYVSRHVVFNEHEFPFHTGFLNTKAPESSTLITTPNWFPLPATTTLNPTLSSTAISSSQDAFGDQSTPSPSNPSLSHESAPETVPFEGGTNEATSNSGFDEFE
ncbi:hypothetical protein UlMin_010930 [Ulmus minor]